MPIRKLRVIPVRMSDGLLARVKRRADAADITQAEQIRTMLEFADRRLAPPEVLHADPHSRACGIAPHAHGSACSPDCPSCRGCPSCGGS